MNTNIEIAKPILRNESTKLSQKQILENIDYVLNSFENIQNEECTDVNKLTNN